MIERTGIFATLRGAFGRGNGTGAPSARRRLLALAAAVLAIAAILGAASASAVAPVVAPPTATDVEFTTAHLDGEVNPEDHETSYHFEYITDAQYLANEGNAEALFTGATETATQTLAENAGLTPVEADLVGLAPETAYHLRLVATNTEAETVEGIAGSTFTTKGPVIKPTVTIDTPSVINPATGTFAFTGHVNPGGTDPAFATTWKFTCSPSCGSPAGATIAADESSHLVEAEVEGLEAKTTYTVTLHATNSAGEQTAQTTFKSSAMPPAVRAFAAGPVASDQVSINGEVNPRGSATEYWFEWGSADCTSNPCQSIPAGHDADAGDGPYFVYATKHLSGLQPNTTYHFQLVAKNASGTTEGPDLTFTTAQTEGACSNPGALGTDFLPGCRAWEMVSPPDKNGRDVIPQTTKTHVATGGDAVTFSSVGAFGDLQGTSFDAEYIARRTMAPGTNGWTTRGINPPGASLNQSATGFAQGNNIPTYLDAFAPDLSAAVYRSWRPLTEAPNASEVTNLYRIEHLGSGAAEPQLMTDSVAPQPASWPAAAKVYLPPAFVGASTDLSHVVFESTLNLTADAPPYQGFLCAFFIASRELFGCPPRLYENADGAVRLVGRVPSVSDPECDDLAGPPCIAAPSVEAGIGGFQRQYSQRMVSASGDRILFQTPAGYNGGDIYLREDGSRTYRLNLSESEPAAPAQAAMLWDASRDGSRAFFSTSAQLLDSDHDAAPDLYMYEVEKPAGNRLTLISASAASDGYLETVIGASDDGRYVYFVADRQLVPGQPPADFMGIYLWHGGDLTYIGALDGSLIAQNNGPRTEWNSVQPMKTSRVTPDGRHLLFMNSSDAGLAGRGGFPGYDHANHRELYLYSADSGRLACASCNPSGAAATADAVTATREVAGASVLTSDLAHALSDDGRHVFFTTRDALLSADTNGVEDAYAYDAVSGAVRLLSSGTDPSPSYFIDASDDASDVFFATRQPISDWDTDSAYDLYDARVQGGLPEPAARPAICTGDSCLHPLPPSLPLAPTASEYPGLGNPSRACPRGTRRVLREGRLRCVKRHAKHRKHSRHRVGADRRESR